MYVVRSEFTDGTVEYKHAESYTIVRQIMEQIFIHIGNRWSVECIFLAKQAPKVMFKVTF